MKRNVFEQNVLMKVVVGESLDLLILIVDHFMWKPTIQNTHVALISKIIGWQILGWQITILL